MRNGNLIFRIKNRPIIQHVSAVSVLTPAGAGGFAGEDSNSVNLMKISIFIDIHAKTEGSETVKKIISARLVQNIINGWIVIRNSEGDGPASSGPLEPSQRGSTPRSLASTK